MENESGLDTVRPEGVAMKLHSTHGQCGAAEGPSAAACWNGNIDVLLVEDNPGDVELLRHTLRQVPNWPCRLVHAERLSDAADHLDRGKAFGVILLDLHLPDSAGMDTVQRMHAAASGTPIIVFTSVEDEATGIEAVRLGAQDYLVKGEANGWALRRAICYAMERTRLTRELLALNETLEQRVAERTEEVRQRAEELQAAAAELAHVEHRERSRLAQALHDHLQQLLVGVKLRADALRGRVAEEAHRQALTEIDRLLLESLQVSRDLMVDLSPPVLREGTLPQVIEWLAHWMHDKHRLVVHVRLDPQADIRTPELRSFIFQAVRELLFNVVKHARVQSACLDLIRLNGHLRVMVADSGPGFDVAEQIASHTRKESFGLASIRDRLRLMGGRLEIESTRGRGTRATILVPVPPAPSQSTPGP